MLKIIHGQKPLVANNRETRRLVHSFEEVEWIRNVKHPYHGQQW